MTVQTGPQYINHCRALGFSDGEITDAMRKVGWHDADIHAAFSEAAHQAKNTNQPKKSKTLLWILLGIVGIFVLAAIGSGIYFVATS